MPKAKSQNLRAFTLMEMAIVLAAIGVILGAMWAVSSVVMEKSAQRQTLQQILTVVENIRAFYGPSGAKPGADGADVTATVNARRMIPIEMRQTQSDNNGNIINHAMSISNNGTFKVIAVNSSNFRIELQNLTKKGCINLLMAFPVLTPEIGVKRMAVGGNAITVDLSTITAINTTLPFRITTATNWCGGATNTLDIDFSYRG